MKNIDEIKSYGKVYVMSASAVAENRERVERELFCDMAKALMEIGILTIHSENTIPGVQVTYGWKLRYDLVRCKNCKHWREDGYCTYNNHTQENKDWFCADGECRT